MLDPQAQAQPQLYVGRHRYSSGGDLFHMVPAGEMTPTEARKMSDEMLRLSNQGRPIVLLIDLSQMDKPSPETRRVINQSIQELNLLAVVFYGAGLILRTALTLVTRGAAILKGQSYPTQFCANEAAARDWLANLRAQAATK